MNKGFAQRTVHCQDAISWLSEWQKPTQTVSMLASLPDISEFASYSTEEWKCWFIKTASLILSKCSDEGVTVFFQSDIKREGEWVDKGYLCQKAAEACGHSLLFHKIVCRAPAGTATFGRPGYSHLLAFSKVLKLNDLGTSTPDIISENGEKTWTRGMGIKTCLTISKFLAEQTSTKLLVNPFCGEGSMLAAANHAGIDVVGIERSAKRAERARHQHVNQDGSGWQLCPT
jgi:hypothetical protein